MTNLYVYWLKLHNYANSKELKILIFTYLNKNIAITQANASEQILKRKKAKKKNVVSPENIFSGKNKNRVGLLIDLS